MINVSDLKLYLTKYGQEHLLNFWNKLSSVEREELYLDIKDVNFEEVISYFNSAVSEIKENKEKLDDRMKPVPRNSFGSVKRTNEDLLKTYEMEGFKQISENAVGVLLMAGGQGTRLGVKYPKGMYDVELPSHKSLFQIQAERIKKLTELCLQYTGKLGTITWFIMTSEHTMEPTLDFFARHNYFGLNKNDVVIFEQFLLPAFTFDGKLIMENTHKISKSPDGNGGLYKALKDRNILDKIQDRGIKYLHAHSVDNILVKVADPVFIGYCVLKGAECGAKVVEKSCPAEPVGVVCTVDGRFQVVEYSEVTSKTAEKRDNSGKLMFNAGNICNHFFTTKFLRRITEKHEKSLKLHMAKKKIPCVDQDGNAVSPEKPNGIKIEKFIFDVFPYSDKLAVWEVNREDEFSALKNSDELDKDNPTTARNSLFALHRRYIENAGGNVEKSNDDDQIVCEISPLVSYSGEGLADLVSDRTFKSPVLLKVPIE